MNVFNISSRQSIMFKVDDFRLNTPSLYEVSCLISVVPLTLASKWLFRVTGFVCINGPAGTGLPTLRWTWLLVSVLPSSRPPPPPPSSAAVGRWFSLTSSPWAAAAPADTHRNRPPIYNFFPSFPLPDLLRVHHPFLTSSKSSRFREEGYSATLWLKISVLITGIRGHVAECHKGSP